MSITLGILSDTHGLVRHETIEALAGSDFLVHAGDIGGHDVLEELERIAPVFAVRGNNDMAPWSAAIPLSRTEEFGGVSVHVIHDIADLGQAGKDADLVVFGHSHRPALEERSDVTLLNPGSCGPRRFTLPVGVARVRIEDGRFEAELIDLFGSSSTETNSRKRSQTK